MLEKLISCYDHVNDGPVDEDVIFGKSRKAISFIEKLEEESGDEFNLGNIGGPGVLEELQGQHGFLRESIEQLKLAESSRSTLLLHLREALLEQEFKIEQVRKHLQVAQSRYEQVEQLLIGQTVPPLPNQQLNEVSPPPPPPSSFSEVPPPPDYPPESPTRDMALSSPINYTQQHPQVSYVDTTSPHTTNEEHRKASAAEVAAKLTASTSSAQMLSYVLSSLSTSGGIGQSMDEDYPSDGKRPRLNGGLISVPCYMPQPQQPPPPPFPHPDSLQPLPPPLPPSVSPIPPPLLTSAPASPQFGQTTGSMIGFPYTYGLPLPSAQLPPYPVVGMPPYPGPPNPYTFQGSDNIALFGQQMLMAAPPPPMPRQ
ncbi:regulation of nuclear pre-mRNA domain-containing protein 1B [Iris pallida]|uniref:Regulation of nuclear pre-mRNA domain-containing protein 1B n=1 Tax=Iris pallida TaxID=29817 RepID=A0AAX6FXQ6_IRIPA|nr:regulation of nuclear pre-mRNA domain-containing protein 1B [Iris pallida]